MKAKGAKKIVPQPRPEDEDMALEPPNVDFEAEGLVFG
jgi:hypothetical protein